ncbi:MAG: hypothetical protein J1D88_03420 [Treponema sp.]|nr:hypothetical protein [Treponema sp.]
MNTRHLLESVIKDWPAKVICFVIVFFIYFFHQMSLLGKKTFTVPLSVTATGSMIPAENLGRNRFVKVTVRARREQLATVTENDLSATVDVSAFTREGVCNAPVIVIPNERLLLMDSLEIHAVPERVPLLLETRTTRYVPVHVQLSGDCAYGYEVAAVTSVPATVRVDGPRSMVESLSGIDTEEVALEGRMRTMQVEVPVQNQNSLVSLMHTEPVQVTVTIAAEGMTRTISDVRITFTNIPSFLNVSSPTSVLDVTLEGKVNVLESLSPASVSAVVSCTSVAEPGTYELPVTVTAPMNATVTAQSIATIMVSASELPGEPEAQEDVQ